MNIDLKLISEHFSDVEFFLACIFPDSPPSFTGSSPTLALVNTPDFWALSSRSPQHGAGLAHTLAGVQLLFRGYEPETSVHSYSSAADLLRIVAPEALRNGSFAWIKFEPAVQQALIRSDAFGFGPLYYRQLNGAWYFASHPTLLHIASDVPDLSSWASLMQNGYPLGNGSFYEDIKRVGPGVQMRLTRTTADTEQWFDFAALAAGNETIDDQAFVRVEAAYMAAMNRCLKLDVGPVVLPFSSGFDSRRFFATLLRKAVPFKAVTCQTYHKKNGKAYDIDSYFAPQIAAAFGVECELVTAVPPDQMNADQARRQTLIGTETFMHAWALPLMRWLAKRPPSLIFDGLAGDTFGNSGFEIPGLHETPERDAELVLAKTTSPALLGQLSSRFPGITAWRTAYRAFLAQFSANLNQAELAFLQSRTRRAISPWITMMHPPGHVVVFPYCDLDFALATLAYHPAEKYKYFFQKECLRRFYPEFYDFAGSRNLPADHPPLDAATSAARDRAEQDFAYQAPGAMRAARAFLSRPNQALLSLSAVVPALRAWRGWLFEPLLLLVRTQREAPSFLDADAAAPAERITGSIDLTNPPMQKRG